MTTETTPRIAALLREAERAHGAYETDALGGARDEDWPRWYAIYLLNNGLRQSLPGAEGLGVEGLATRLRQLAADYEREQPQEAWPDVYARQLAAALG